MNLSNATALRLELLKFVCFLQTLSPLQISALSQFVQFEEDKDQKWPLQQLGQVLEKSTPQQVEQIISITAARKDDDYDVSPEKRTRLEQLAHQLSAPSSLLDVFGPLFQMYQLQDIMQSFSYVQLMKFCEVIPHGTPQRQQLQLLQHLQQLFQNIHPTILQNLHQDFQDASSSSSTTLSPTSSPMSPSSSMSSEQQQLAGALQLPPEQYHLYQPLRSLLHMELRELLSFQEVLPRLRPIQTLQLLQMLQLQPYDLIELKRLLLQESASSIIDLPFEFSSESMDQEKTLTLQIVDQPPEKAVYRRNVKPNPSVLLVGDNNPQEGELFVFATLIRCDTFAEEHRFLNGNKPIPITTGRVATFRKLKILVTSHQQQETLFSLRFELRRKNSEDDYETLASVTTNPIMVLSHSTQMKPVPAAVPVVSEVIPSSGPATGGTRVAILGSNFVDTPALRIRFDNNDVMPEFKGQGTLVCSTPQHAPGPVLVRVANGSFWSETGCTFTYADPVRSAGVAAAGIVPMFGPLDTMSYGWDVTGIQARSAAGALSLNTIDSLGYAPLHYTASGNNPEPTQFLLAHRPVLDVRDARGNTPLHWATAFNNIKQVDLLLRNGASCNVQNNLGLTPLHWACAQGHLELVLFLVEIGGASVTISDVDGATPIHIASALGYTSIVSYLLDHGAYVYAEDDFGDSAMHWAVREGHEDVVSVLLTVHDTYQAHTQPYLPCNEDGETPLHAAAAIGSATLVEQLLRHHNIPVNARDIGGWTALHYAAAAGYDNVVRVILSQLGTVDIDLNSSDWEGNTPLHLACQESNEEVALRLIIAGADTRRRDVRGLTPLNYSQRIAQKADLIRSSPAFALSVQQQQQQQELLHAKFGRPHNDVDIDKLINPMVVQNDEAPRPPFMRTVMSWLGRAFLKGEPLDAPIHAEI